MTAEVTVKTKNKPKFNVKAMIGPLDVPAEPKTLKECHTEAGCLPFTAVALADSPINKHHCPKGSEVTFIENAISGHPNALGRLVYVDINSEKNGFSHLADIPRWSLVGHKP